MTSGLVSNMYCLLVHTYLSKRYTFPFGSGLSWLFLHDTTTAVVYQNVEILYQLWSFLGLVSGSFAKEPWALVPYLQFAQKH